MGISTSLHSDKSRVRSLAKPDGSFSWQIKDVYELKPPLSTPIDFQEYSTSVSGDVVRIKNMIEINGIRVDINDAEFWSIIFSDEFISKLDRISIDCGSEALCFLLPHLHLLCRPSLVSCKPFNFDWTLPPSDLSPEEYMQLMSIIASLIRQNRLVTVALPNNYCVERIYEKAPRIYIESYMSIVNAIAVSHSLISLDWPGGIERDSEYSRPGCKQVTPAMLAALEKNTSLTETAFYGRNEYYGWDDVIIPILSRNKALPGMNAAIAIGQIDSEWNESCPSDLVRQLLGAKFNLHRAFFDTTGDMCFCEFCHKKTGNRTLYTHGDPPSRYVLPMGWMRLGLKVHEGFAESNDIFRKWHISYHGTTANNLEPIFRGGLQLLKPGDVALGGIAICIRSGHILKPIRRINLYTNLEENFDINQIFTSPSIRYSSHPVYAQQFVVDHPRRPGVRLGMRFVFQCRQRPNSYKIGQETVGARNTQLDPHFANKELEWYTKENSGIVLSGLCVQLQYVTRS